MEPLVIRLHNFTSYEDAEVNLAGVELAALVGTNGAGKSSIIDALLWCLFGEATKGGIKALDNYVRRGETECRVEVQFRLHGQVYSVLRHRSAGKGKTLLELFVADDPANWPNVHWQPIGGKTVTETQERIEQLLRMDYRTFTASSMILQGQSASLTADMTDQERKEVLARILGLDLWDRLQEAAREKAREHRARAKALTEQGAQLMQRAARRGEVEAQIATSDGALLEAEAVSSQAGAHVADLEAEARQRPAIEQQLRDVDGQINARVRDQDQVAGDMSRTEAEVAAEQARLNRRAAIEAQLPDLEIAHAATRVELERRQEAVTALEAQVRQSESIIQQARDLDSQIAARQVDQAQVVQEGTEARRQQDLQKAIVIRAEQIRTAAAAADSIAADITRLDGLAERYGTLDRQCRDLEAQVIAWDRQHDTDVARLQAELDAAHRQSRSLGDAPCGDDLRPVCPLLAGAREAAEREHAVAGQLLALTPVQNPHVDAWQGAMVERDELGYDPAAHAGARKGLSDVQADARLLPVLEAAEQRVTELQAQVEALRKRHGAISHELETLTASRERLADAAARVGRITEALTVERAKLAQATTAEADARTQFARAQQALEEAAAGEAEARRRISDLGQRQSELQQRLGALAGEVESLRTRRTDLQQRLTALSGVEVELLTARTALDAARRREAEIREQLGRLRQDLAQVEEAEARALAVQSEIAAVERQALVYEILDQASGKKAGVPALIVENAVPQIEHLANELLVRMAGGRLAIRLDTQVEGKTTGTAQEVLRITVLDGGVDRPYQTYSGAERFMVDLALRIALSKFLAHRSGAEIKLLVLDEGLGALDGSNRHQVMGAIHEAAREFSKVLVVTHIAELQDALPQRIEVTRGASGSTVRVVA